MRLSTLPTAFGIGFAAGASGVALRGLTVNSTLVLIDGRRAAPYALADDGQRSFVDLNTIPLDAVERIEVLKDGASSIYGADAIAGVVNVILKKQYQGAEVNVEIGKGQHPGGGERRLTASFGTGDLETDRFNAYVNFEFQGDDRILSSDRSRCRCVVGCSLFILYACEFRRSNQCSVIFTYLGIRNTR